MIGFPFLKTKATAHAGLGKRQVTLWLLLWSSRKPPLTCCCCCEAPQCPLLDKPVWSSWLLNNYLRTVCGELESTFLEIHWESSEGERKHIKTPSVDAWFSQLTMASVSEETRKHSVSTWILLPPQKQQFERPGSEFMRNLAFAVRMMRVVSAEDLPYGSGRGFHKLTLHPITEFSLRVKKEDAGQSFYSPVSTGHNKHPSTRPATRKLQKRTLLQEL